MSITPAQALRPVQTPARAAAAAFVGSTIEWYDFFLYGTAAALVFDKLFFPESNASSILGKDTAQISSYATYAVGFFSRPVGGIIFGHLGDRIGRKQSLIITLVMMGLSTFLVGCLPTYARIGLWAPLLLSLLRFFQGVAVGGEWGGAALLAVEHSTPGQRGWYSSWMQCGLPVGLLLSNGVFKLCSSLPEEQFMAWGWRIPFLAGIILAVIGYFIRRHVAESPLFEEVVQQEAVEKNPLWKACVDDWRSILIVIGARIADNASFYLFSVFVLSFATKNLSLDRSMVLNGIMVAAVAELGAILWLGQLSDRVGRRPVYMFGLVVFFLLPFPYFWLLGTKETSLVWLAIVISLGVSHAAMYAPQAAFYAELFGTRAFSI